MYQLYWTPLAINMFVGILMAQVMATYFLFQLIADLRGGREWRLSCLSFLTMAAVGTGGAFQFAAYVLHPDYVNFLLPWVSVFGAAAVGFYTFFALQLQRPLGERRVIGVVVGLFFSALVCVEIFVAVERVALLRQGLVEYREAWLDFPFSAAFVVAQSIFLAQLVIAIASEQGIARRHAIGPAVLSVLNLRRRLSKPASTARAYFYSALMPLSLAVAALLRSYGLIDWRTAELLMSWLLLLTFAGFGLAYLNYIPERSTFQIKLVGATLVAVFGILSGIAWLIGPVYINAYENPSQLQSLTSIRFAPDGNGSYHVENTVYHIDERRGERLKNPEEALSLPFDFPFYDQSYRALFVRHGGIIGFEQLPLWRDIQHRFGPQPAIFLLAAELKETADPDSGLFVHAAPDKITLTWHRLVSAFADDETYSFQLRLFPTGVIEIAYTELPKRPHPDIYLPHSAPMMTGIVPGFENRQVTPVDFTNDLPLTLPAGHGGMASYRVDFMAYLNHIYQPTAMFIIVSALMVLVVFPLFFQVNLNRPLQAMMRGVRGIMQGDLKTRIPVSYPDEIGYLAASFNEMAVAQQDLVRTLEDKVAARTEEAVEYAASNARLEERNHLMRELHDTVSQTLFSANLIADRLPDLWQRNPQEGAGVLQEMCQLNREALSEMRQLLLVLRSDAMMNRSFGQLLQGLVQKFETSLKIDLQIGADTSFAPEVQLTFFRIAQEALNNIVKHAGTDQATIQFDGLTDQAMLSIRDQGVGFEQDGILAENLGLRFMGERMREIGGSLEIESGSGQGTTITAIWFANGRR